MVILPLLLVLFAHAQGQGYQATIHITLPFHGMASGLNILIHFNTKLNTTLTLIGTGLAETIATFFC